MHKTKHKERNLSAECFFVDHLASRKIRKGKKWEKSIRKEKHETNNYRSNYRNNLSFADIATNNNNNNNDNNNNNNNNNNINVFFSRACYLLLQFLFLGFFCL